MAKELSPRTVNTRIGKREIAPEAIICFPHGLIGFEREREFALLTMDEGSPFLLLQSLQDPGLGLLVTDPYTFMDDFQAKLGQAEKRLLGIKNMRQAAILVTVSIPQGQPEKVALNLSGPIVINSEARVGLQVPQVDADRPSRFYIKQGLYE